MQTAVIGQVVSWSLTVTGGSTLNEQYPINEGAGVLRLDSACTAPGEPCVGP